MIQYQAINLFPEFINSNEFSKHKVPVYLVPIGPWVLLLRYLAFYLRKFSKIGTRYNDFCCGPRGL